MGTIRSREEQQNEKVDDETGKGVVSLLSSPRQTFHRRTLGNTSPGNLFNNQYWRHDPEAAKKRWIAAQEELNYKLLPQLWMAFDIVRACVQHKAGMLFQQIEIAMVKMNALTQWFVEMDRCSLECYVEEQSKVVDGLFAVIKSHELGNDM
jgi:hypothetical protein